MRCDQFMGLNSWASKLVNQTKTVKEVGERIADDGAIEPFSRVVQIPVVKTEECGASFFGMFDEEYSLVKHILPDGRVFSEYVQAEPWSSGPCFFLALKDEKGEPVPESLWSQDEIDDA